METKSKRFCIKTLGCKVNQYESQLMRELLTKEGFLECLAEDIADIYIINTCTVTSRADSASRHAIGTYHRMNPKASIIVAGCYIEKDAYDVSFLPGVVGVVKNDEKHRIAAILNGTVTTDKDTGSQWTPITDFKGLSKAFLKVQDGCNNRCAYCKVPLVRGPSRSKPIDIAVGEAAALVAKGFREIVLTGICLGAWGTDFKERRSLVDLLAAIDALGGDFRVRLSSIEPLQVTDELIDFMAAHRRVCRHLHIPLQSGDDDLLRLMNRPYSAEFFLTLAKKVRAALPDVAITTDIMVGFPGETDERFKNSLATVRALAPARSHIFSYSRREGTAAAATGEEIPVEKTKKRYTAMKVVALETSFLFRSLYRSRALEVLVETGRDRETGLLQGYSDNYIRVLFSGPDSIRNSVVPVRVNHMTLEATLGYIAPKRNADLYAAPA